MVLLRRGETSLFPPFTRKNRSNSPLSEAFKATVSALSFLMPRGAVLTVAGGGGRGEWVGDRLLSDWLTSLCLGSTWLHLGC